MCKHSEDHSQSTTLQGVSGSLSVHIHFKFFYYGLPGITQLTRKSPIVLKLILRGSPDRGLNVPSEGREGKPSTKFLHEVGLSAPEREINLCCYWDWNPIDPSIRSPVIGHQQPNNISYASSPTCTYLTSISYCIVASANICCEARAAIQ